MTIDLILNGAAQGLILAIVAYSIMIPFRFLDFADLSSEGAYPLGGAVCATCLSFVEMSPWAAVSLGMLAAGIIGVCAALIHLKFKINSMLAGIILSAMAYSVNLRVMGKPNIALFNCPAMFGLDVIDNIAKLLFVLVAIVLPLSLFLRTDFGLRFRSVGLNKNFAIKQKISVEKNVVLGLFIAGMLAGLAGGLMVQIQSYMDIGMGVGILIHGLASLMIGETIIGNQSLNRQLLAPLIGATVYQQIQGFALSFGLAPSDLKFFTGAIVLLVIMTQARNSRLKL